MMQPVWLPPFVTIRFPSPVNGVPGVDVGLDPFVVVGLDPFVVVGLEDVVVGDGSRVVGAGEPDLGR
jgi:hypothetical protein